MNRRKLVQSAVAVGVLSGLPVAAGSELPKTPRDFTGPFYPKGPRNKKNDLIAGEPQAEILHLSGRVLAPNGDPRPGLLVDIWQADPNGRYKHPRDSGQDSLMDEFLYWGEALTNAEARFRFRTYVPGRYAARPAQHIHYKVWSNTQELLTSQIYFDELGGARGLARSQRAALQTVSLERIDDDNFGAELDIVI
ncbi:MAG: hypothetical protein OXU77_01375 [Gammaproteobacteria bacterium]|nr:hypothetical protein [Gammaproteobacteria bacterium]MDE0443446.1 hypothetical protein [Gammaproteobacteria bacterium]